jgi:hypothetical protein
VERRIDLALLGDRVFVNNASLGVYATVVQSDAYRDAKLATTAQLLPDLRPDAQRFDLRSTRPTVQTRRLRTSCSSPTGCTGWTGSTGSVRGSGSTPDRSASSP